MTQTSSASNELHAKVLLKNVLLTCGILSSIYYVAINILVPLQWKEYSMMSQAVSELSAVDAPTRPLWVMLASLYVILFGLFGWGILKSSQGKGLLRVAGILTICYAVFNIFWPPMHLRETLAAGGGTTSDTLHIAWTMVALFFMLMLMVFGAIVFGKPFRIYTVATIIVFIVFGSLTAADAPNMEMNLPTPYLGLWEHVNIAAFMLWVVVFAISLLRRNKVLGESKRSEEKNLNVQPM